MYSKVPAPCLRALQESQRQNRSIQHLEREYLQFDYCEAGCLLMQLWRLPEVYQQVASFHLDPQRADIKFQYETQVVHLAHTICQNPVIGLHKGLIESCTEKFPQLQHLPSNIDKIIINEIDEHTAPVLTMLWPETLSDVTFDCGTQADE